MREFSSLPLIVQNDILDSFFGGANSKDYFAKKYNVSLSSIEQAILDCENHYKEKPKIGGTKSTFLEAYAELKGSLLYDIIRSIVVLAVLVFSMVKAPYIMLYFGFDAFNNMVISAIFYASFYAVFCIYFVNTMLSFIDNRTFSYLNLKVESEQDYHKDLDTLSPTKRLSFSVAKYYFYMAVWLACLMLSISSSLGVGIVSK